MYLQLRCLTRMPSRPLAIWILPIFLAAPGFNAFAGPDSKPKAEARHATPPKPAGFAAIGLPHYAAPDAYREDLVIENEGKAITMKRFVDHGRSRTEMASEGHSFVMLEMGDEKGTSYTLMPEEKRAMKQSREEMKAVSPKPTAAKGSKDADTKESTATAAPPPEIQAEDLGDETLEGRAVKKVRMTYGKDAQDVMGWFDKATGAPVRMESLVDGKKAIIEWKNRKVEAQPAELFAVPKGYEVTDMDEMMKKMGSMGGGGLPMGGMGAGSMAKGVAGGMAQGMAQGFGANLGATLGASIGGPLGGIAGQFIGGKIGGMIGKKAANAIN